MEKNAKPIRYEFEFVPGKGISFDSIIPDTIGMKVLWNGEWIEPGELYELYLGSDETPYVEGIMFEEI
jgi:hypothetical protein